MSFRYILLNIYQVSNELTTCVWVYKVNLQTVLNVNMFTWYKDASFTLLIVSCKSSFLDFSMKREISTDIKTWFDFVFVGFSFSYYCFIWLCVGILADFSHFYN